MNDHYEIKLTPEDFLPQGWVFRVEKRLHLVGTTSRQRATKIAILMTVAFLPLFLFSWYASHAWGNRVAIPFVYDIDVLARFLFVLPILELGSLWAASALSDQMQCFADLDVIPKHEKGRFRKLVGDVAKFRDSFFADGVIALLAFSIPFLMRVVLFRESQSTWERIGLDITLAGWWQIFVSLPILYFLLLRRLWSFVLWVWFLVRVSRLELKITPSHPDQAGGLGFLGRGLASFSLLAMSCSAIIAAGIGDSIVHQGQSLSELKYHIAFFVGAALLVLHLPLLLFLPQLIRYRKNGLREFGALVVRFDRSFERQWIDRPNANDLHSEEGHADIQTLVNVATGYKHVYEMWPIPFDRKSFALCGLAIVLPMIPLIGTMVEVKEILGDLMGFLL